MIGAKYRERLSNANRHGGLTYGWVAECVGQREMWGFVCVVIQSTVKTGRLGMRGNAGLVVSAKLFFQKKKNHIPLLLSLDNVHVLLKNDGTELSSRLTYG